MSPVRHNSSPLFTLPLPYSTRRALTASLRRDDSFKASVRGASGLMASSKGAHGGIGPFP